MSNKILFNFILKKIRTYTDFVCRSFLLQPKPSAKVVAKAEIHRDAQRFTEKIQEKTVLSALCPEPCALCWSQIQSETADQVAR